LPYPFRLNVVRHAGSAVNILGTDDTQFSEQTRRLLIRDNLFEDVGGATWGGSGRLFQLLNGTLDVTIDHNTAFHAGEVIMASDSAPHQGFVYSNNITAHNQFGVAGDWTFGDPLLTLETYFPDAVFVRNVLVGGDPEDYPLDNFFPATWGDVGFVDLGGGAYRPVGSSPYEGLGTDGEDLGADIEAVLAATAGVVAPPGRLRFFRTGNPCPVRSGGSDSVEPCPSRHHLLEAVESVSRRSPLAPVPTAGSRRSTDQLAGPRPVGIGTCGSAGVPALP
jgi:hypothetical protein